MAWQYRIGVQTQFPYMSAEQINNATEVYNYMRARGATVEAICGLLGNMTHESGLNPGCKQTSSTSSGWGLIQWTPSSVLTRWCTSQRLNWYDGAAQMSRIIAEGTQTLEGGPYWIPTTDYPYTWSEFEQLTDVDTATKAYLYERERAGEAALDRRLQYAEAWYLYFTGQPTPPPPVPPTPPTPYKKDKGMSVWMMIRKKELRYERR